MKTRKKQIYLALRVLLIICVMITVGGIFIALYSAVGEKNDTLGLIGAAIGFGGILLAFIVGKAANKLVDRLGPLESEPVELPEENSEREPSPEKLKRVRLFSRIGWVLSTAALIVMIGGILFAYFGDKIDDENHSLAVLGILIAVAPPLILLAMALLPEKMRGVKKKPRRLRALEVLTALSVLLVFTGIFSTAGIIVFASDKKELILVAGIFAVLGVAGSMIFPKMYYRLTGSYVQIELFPSDKEIENAAYNALNKIGVVDTDEAHERDLDDFERNAAGDTFMTKDQVEEYENNKYLF